MKEFPKSTFQEDSLFNQFNEVTINQQKQFLDKCTDSQIQQLVQQGNMRVNVMRDPKDLIFMGRIYYYVHANRNILLLSEISSDTIDTVIKNCLNFKIVKDTTGGEIGKLVGELEEIFTLFSIQPSRYEKLVGDKVKELLIYIDFLRLHGINGIRQCIDLLYGGISFKGLFPKIGDNLQQKFDEYMNNFGADFGTFDSFLQKRTESMIDFSKGDIQKSLIGNFLKSNPSSGYFFKREGNSDILVVADNLLKRRDFFVKIIDVSGVIALVDKSNKNKSITIDIEELQDAISDGKMDDILNKIDDEYLAEGQNGEIARKYDIPPVPTGLLNIAPIKYDSIVSEDVSLGFYRTQLMKRKYSQIQDVGNIISDNPMEEIRAKIVEMYQKGIHHFHLQISSHGAPDKFEIGNGIKFQEFLELIKIYPDISFSIATVACYGGGSRKQLLSMIQGNPELTQKISLFLQTKPYRPVVIGTFGKNNIPEGPYSTHYNMYFLEGLRNGMTYGSAHEYADKETRKRTYQNPEAVVNGILVSQKLDDSLQWIV